MAGQASLGNWNFILDRGKSKTYLNWVLYYGSSCPFITSGFTISFSSTIYMAHFKNFLLSNTGLFICNHFLPFYYDLDLRVPRYAKIRFHSCFTESFPYYKTHSRDLARGERFEAFTLSYVKMMLNSCIKKWMAKGWKSENKGKALTGKMFSLK